MKKFFLLSFFIALAVTGLNAQNTTTANEAPKNGPRITFNEMEHNYGTIQKGSDGNCEFTFVNEGNEPLILSNVHASCGCTKPTWTKEPIMPGKSSVIKVGYNTNNVQPSTFWMGNARYLRLQELSLSYRLKNTFLQNSLNIRFVDIMLMAENLHVWNSVKIFDPEQARDCGQAYPIPARYSLQLYFTF